MLNIPETVKALFKADGIRKNFRVQFPNGELPDITNENIVQESVKFTESLCSQDVLKFGLTEASVLEFETVGVANMYGMTIEAGIEIDLSSLSAAEIAEIAAGSWDGTYVALADSDLGYAFFRVPYGVFRVESCPRDHQVMTHRQVQAYNRVAPIQQNPFDAYVLRTVAPQKITIDIPRAVLSTIAWNYPNALSGLSKTAFPTPWSTWPPSEATTPYLQYYDTSRTDWHVHLTVKKRRRADVQLTALTNQMTDRGLNALLCVELDATAKSNLDAAVSEIVADLTALNLPQRAIENAVNTFKAFFPGYFLVASKSIYFPVNKGIPIFYCIQIANLFYGHFYFFHSATLDITVKYTDDQNVEQTVTITKTFDMVTNRPTFYYFTGMPTSIIGNYASENFDVNKLANDYFELNAQFGKANRLGQFITKRLTDGQAVTIQPAVFQSFWFDEYDISPFGTIDYNFKDESDQQNAASYIFSEYHSIYDMTDNSVLSAETGGPEVIEPQLDELFIPYIGPIAFTPIDLTMKGLPYLEAGDYLAVTAEDGTVANSFAMRQEISGVQVLEAAIESTSGQIIDISEV